MYVILKGFTISLKSYCNYCRQQRVYIVAGMLQIMVATRTVGTESAFVCKLIPARYDNFG